MKKFGVTLNLLSLAILAPALVHGSDPPMPKNKAVEQSVPAIFVHYLAPPGKSNNMKEPGRVVCDRVSKETSIADLRNNRILIFDSNYVFRFEFFCNGQVNMPMDLATTSEGYYYVLGNSFDGMRIVTYDFDGLFLNTFPLTKIIGGTATEISSLAADEYGKLYLLDPTNHQVTTLDTAGKFIRKFNISGFVPEKDRNELVYGSFFIKDSTLYIPIPTLGAIALYKLDGTFVRTVGIKGTTMGTLTFPFEVSINSQNVILVVDKERFNVVCFTQSGKFIGEFGGKGDSPGWFFYPGRIATNFKDEIIVGQVMNNLVQVCKPPPFLIPVQNP